MPANKFLFSVLTYRPFRLHFSEYHQPHSWPGMSSVPLLELKSRQSSDLGSDSGREPLRMIQAWSLQWPTLGPWAWPIPHFSLAPFSSSLARVIVSYVSLPMTQFLYTEGWYFIFANVLPIPNSCTQYQDVHNGHFLYLFALSQSATPQSCLETSQVNPQGVSCLSLEATSWEYWEIRGTRASFIKKTNHQLRMKNDGWK